MIDKGITPPSKKHNVCRIVSAEDSVEESFVAHGLEYNGKDAVGVEENALVGYVEMAKKALVDELTIDEQSTFAVRSLCLGESMSFPQAGDLLAETFGYATVLRSLTQGRANHTLAFVRYQEVPSTIAETLAPKESIL